ncbi:MAG: iron-sulfur cluster assembly accessory protein [Deltaproteobacteria bacterium]|jgi:iron-sulfur cluster assembly protein|nr:iron-sulfur cluster assembly accessory protein [Deltaproteobacteria bacterium]MBT6432521.1 iron-sulfur cluster assembly accessory protein [Deltaproteobacteria bacterium]MBT6488205.1 iron-sulfur cluster assembly accessory protein [Deltaproteobacteria bacterium]
MITLTEKAITRALQVAERQKIPAILRVGVKGGGCSGLSYFLDFEAGEGREGDSVVEFSGVKVRVDPKSLNYLTETELDFDTNLLNGGFKFRNPQAKRSCSCGESFSV